MDVILYSTGCPKCCILKKKLDEKHIDYIENQNVDEMLALGVSQVPVLAVDGKLMEFGESVQWVNKQ